MFKIVCLTDDNRWITVYNTLPLKIHFSSVASDKMLGRFNTKQTAADL